MYVILKSIYFQKGNYKHIRFLKILFLFILFIYFFITSIRFIPHLFLHLFLYIFLDPSSFIHMNPKSMLCFAEHILFAACQILSAFRAIAAFSQRRPLRRCHSLGVFPPPLPLLLRPSITEFSPPMGTFCHRFRLLCVLRVLGAITGIINPLLLVNGNPTDSPAAATPCPGLRPLWALVRWGCVCVVCMLKLKQKQLLFRFWPSFVIVCG